MTRTRFIFTLLLAISLAGVMLREAAHAQQWQRPVAIDPRAFVRVTLPPNGPLELVQVDYGTSFIMRNQRGMQMALDLMLAVRNRSAKPIEGMAMALGYGFGKPGTEGLSAVSGIRLEPGATYAVPARMRAEIELPPAGARARPVDLPTSVRVSLDSVLFADGSSFGPDQMRVLGAMRINQAESARDRRYFQALTETGGLGRLLGMLEKLDAQAAGASAAAAQRTPRVLAGAAAERARALAQFADFRVARLPGAPLEIVSARARVYDAGLVDPALEIRNAGGAEVADFQVAWVLRDASGREFRAATVSGSSRSRAARSLPLAAGESWAWSDPAVLETGPASGPILSGRVYLRAVQFADGRVWVPERAQLEAAGLSGVFTYSPEAIRLLRLYQSRGPAALTAELRR